MTLFQFRYRVESSLNQNWDYRPPGYYFITICTKHLAHYLGTITNGHIDLSPVGKIAQFELLRTPEIGLDEWVIMPNHVHVIFRILPNVPTIPNGPQSRNIPTVVRGFKSAVKRWTNLYGLPMEWQSQYHDRIIRDEDGLQQIRWYIRKNPAVWRSDVFYRELP